MSGITEARMLDTKIKFHLVQMAAILDFVIFQCLKKKKNLGSLANFVQYRLLSHQKNVGAFIWPMSFILKSDANKPNGVHKMLNHFTIKFAASDGKTHASIQLIRNGVMFIQQSVVYR